MKLRRRAVLATASAAGVSLAGCLGLDGLLGGSEVSGTDNWEQPRGSASATGFNSVDTSPPAGRAFDATLEDGFAGTPIRAPLVGDDAVYAVGRTASPYESDPPEFTLYAYALSREDGSQRWRTEITSHEGTSGDKAVRDFTAALGPDAMYTVHMDTREDHFGVYVTKVARDGSSVEELISFEGGVTALPPVVDDGTLFTYDPKGRLVAVSTDDGSVRYRTGQYIRRYFGGHPAVGADAIAFVNGGDYSPSDESAEDSPEWMQVSVFDRENGEHRWSQEIGHARSLPSIANDTVYVVDGDSGVRPYRNSVDSSDTIPPRSVRAFALEDGTERWSFEYEREATKTAYSHGGATTVSVDDDSVYLALGFDDYGGPGTSPEVQEAYKSNRYRGPNLFALDSGDGTVRWKTTLGESAKVFAPTAVDENYLYALRKPIQTDPVLSIVDKTDGSVTRTLSDGFRGEVPFALADGECYQLNGFVRAWQ